jgi:DNA (cytosine-5)-methyltransferase 1
MRYLSVCSGMEAASVAWHPLGWTPVGFSEIEPFPCAILKHRFPNIPNHGSLTEYQSWPIEPGSIDLLVGGTPCQSFSVAGLRKGLADPRGNLALTFLGLADKLKPRWIVWENVPGVLSSGGGRDFGSFLGALVELGYGFAYRVLDAQHFGVPQRRRRVFVVACLGDWRAAAEVLSLREGLRGYLETGNKKRKGVAADAGASVEASGEGVATPFRKSKQACSTTDNETWVPANASNTLNNFDLGDTRTTHAVVQHQMPGSVAPTIGASGPPYSRTGNERVEAEALAITFQPGNLRREAGADPSFTTTTTTLKASAGDQTPHVACFKSGQGAQSRSIGWSESVSPTLPSNAGGNTAPAVIGLNPPMAVRRLTPVECERLQGFPDNWSRISWKGKPEEQCPDGPRYKACGNSMAVPVMRWIGERIAAVDATLSPHA